GWHASGHTLTGGHFGTFDSPANPLFFLWHNAINDVWVDYRACP
ncbi:tyrosinase family protein, partial [Kaarinaea lacus]